MQLILPKTKDLIKERNSVIQTSLRNPESKLKVEDEYPIVLEPSNSQYSYCLMDDNQIVCHANLWPRNICCPSGNLPIGLIGNVATRESHRNKGLMSLLFQNLEKIALGKNLSALVLWSDLDKFYEKLGFSPIGLEKRFYLAFTSPSQKSESFTKHKSDNIPDSLVSDILNLRFNHEITIERTVDEFKRLLRIPEMDLFTLETRSKISSYCLLGKGEDMFGVVHEWGAPDPKELIKLLEQVSSCKRFPEMILLTPHTLREDWENQLLKVSKYFETHPMALGKVIAPNQISNRIINNLFIWGLDSI